MSAPDPKVVEAELRAAIGAVMARHGEFASQWVVIVESIGAMSEDSQRGLWMTVGEGARAWDTMGLLSFALERERASIHAEIAREENG